LRSIHLSQVIVGHVSPAAAAREAAAQGRATDAQESAERIIACPAASPIAQEKDTAKSELFTSRVTSAGGSSKQGLNREFQRCCR